MSLMNADPLRWMQSVENNGRGVSCVRSICSCLDGNDFDGAKAITHNEWDKIRNYPNIAQWLKDNELADKDWV